MSGMTAPSYNQNFYLDTLNLTYELLTDILLDLHTIGDFAVEKEFVWNRRIQKLTVDISKFVEVTTLLSKLILIKKNISIAPVKSSHIHLLFVMKGINQAQQKQDYLVLEDLIKYELKDNLTQWKIDLIPQIKTALNT